MRKPTYRSLAMETLESRTPMAGDVTAVLVGDTLNITGDNAANGLIITQPAANRINIRPFETAGSATRLNGQTADLEFMTTSTSLKINLAGGDDQVLLGTFVFGGTHIDLASLSVDLGTGNDGLVLGDVTVNGDVNLTLGTVDNFDADVVLIAAGRFSGNVNIALGYDRDELNVQGSTIQGQLKIDAGFGNDRVMLNDVETGALNVALGEGHDELGVAETNVFGGRGTTTIDGGNGDDKLQFDDVTVLNKLVVNLGNGANRLYGGMTNGPVDPTRDGAFSVDARQGLQVVGGEGADRVELEKAGTGGVLAVQLGEGNDELKLNGFAKDLAQSRAKALKIDMGRGDDVVVLESIYTAKIGVRLSDGDDVFAAQFLNTDAVRTDAGKGADRVGIGKATLPRLQVTLGDGDDGFASQELTVTRSLVVNGGNGVNQLFASDLLPNRFPAKAKFLKFFVPI